MRSNNELYDLINEIDIVLRVRILLLRWMARPCRSDVEEDISTRQVYDAEISRSLRKGQSCLCWKEQIEEALSFIDVKSQWWMEGFVKAERFSINGLLMTN